MSKKEKNTENETKKEENVKEERHYTEEEKVNLFIELTKKRISLANICESLNISEFEALSLKQKANEKGFNVVSGQRGNDVIFYNQGENNNVDDDIIQFKTDDNRSFKFIAISNSYLGNKAQQLSIINDIYKKAKELGINTVFLCGNLTAGTYNIDNVYYESLFIHDKESQVDYFIDNFPKVEGITTYFIGGPKDNKGKISVGTRISNARPDMIYLGSNNAIVKIDDAIMKIISASPRKNYTVSDRSQKKIESLRPEDKPDIILYGCLGQADHVYQRECDIYTIPSLCATTEEMEGKDYSNNVGALIFDVTIKPPEIKKKKSLKYRDNKKTKRTGTIKVTAIPYYKTDKNDYKKVNIITDKKSIITEKDYKDDISKQTALKYFNYFKNGRSVDEFKSTFHLNDSELFGLIELCKMYGLYVSVRLNDKNELVFEKEIPRNQIIKPSFDSKDILVKEYLIVSDTHLCNIHQQLGICYELYEEAYKRGITTAIHGGDMIDGYYKNRVQYPPQNFLLTFDEQTEYVIDNYPRFPGIITKVTQGNHEKTHDYNGGANALKWIAKMRDDIEYTGVDRSDYIFDGIRFRIDHPGDGSAKAFSYALQKSLINDSSFSPNIFISAHYHKWYEMQYKNIFAFSSPCLCGQTNFEMTHKLQPMVGGFFLKVYVNKKTESVEFIQSEPWIYGEDQLIDEAGLDLKQIIQKRKKLIKK